MGDEVSVERYWTVTVTVDMTDVLPDVPVMVNVVPPVEVRLSEPLCDAIVVPSPR